MCDKKDYAEIRKKILERKRPKFQSVPLELTCDFLFRTYQNKKYLAGLPEKIQELSADWKFKFSTEKTNDYASYLINKYSIVLSEEYNRFFEQNNMLNRITDIRNFLNKKEHSNPEEDAETIKNIITSFLTIKTEGTTIGSLMETGERKFHHLLPSTSGIYTFGVRVDHEEFSNDIYYNDRNGNFYLLSHGQKEIVNSTKELENIYLVMIGAYNNSGILENRETLCLDTEENYPGHNLMIWISEYLTEILFSPNVDVDELIANYINRSIDETKPFDNTNYDVKSILLSIMLYYTSVGCFSNKGFMPNIQEIYYSALDVFDKVDDKLEAFLEMSYRIEPNQGYNELVARDALTKVIEGKEVLPEEHDKVFYYLDMLFIECIEGKVGSKLICNVLENIDVDKLPNDILKSLHEANGYNEFIRLVCKPEVVEAINFGEFGKSSVSALQNLLNYLIVLYYRNSNIIFKNTVSETYIRFLESNNITRLSYDKLIPLNAKRFYANPDIQIEEIRNRLERYFLDSLKLKLVLLMESVASRELKSSLEILKVKIIVKEKNMEKLNQNKEIFVEGLLKDKGERVSQLEELKNLDLDSATHLTDEEKTSIKAAIETSEKDLEGIQEETIRLELDSKTEEECQAISDKYRSMLVGISKHLDELIQKVTIKVEEVTEEGVKEAEDVKQDHKEKVEEKNKEHKSEKENAVTEDESLFDKAVDFVTSKEFLITGACLAAGYLGYLAYKKLKEENNEGDEGEVFLSGEQSFAPSVNSIIRNATDEAVKCGSNAISKSISDNISSSISSKFFKFRF